MPTSLAALAPFTREDPDASWHPRDERVDLGQRGWRSAAGRGQGNDSHTQVAASYFTCPAGHAEQQRSVQLRQRRRSSTPSRSALRWITSWLQQLSPDGTPAAHDGLATGATARSRRISYSKTSTDPTDAATAYPGLGNADAGLQRPHGSASRRPPRRRPDGRRTPTRRFAASALCDLVKDDLARSKRLRHERAGQAEARRLEGARATRSGRSLPTRASARRTWQRCSARLEPTPTSRRTGRHRGYDQVTDTMDGADMYSAIAVLAACATTTRSSS